MELSRPVVRYRLYEIINFKLLNLWGPHMLSAVCAIALLGAVSLAVVIACKKLDIPGDCRTCSSGWWLMVAQSRPPPTSKCKEKINNVMPAARWSYLFYLGNTWRHTDQRCELENPKREEMYFATRPRELLWIAAMNERGCGRSDVRVFPHPTHREILKRISKQMAPINRVWYFK